MHKAVDDTAKAGGGGNESIANVAAGDAGKLFASGGNANAGANADAGGAAEAAGKAVSAVSGDQILKAIVDAAGATEGKGAATAANAVEAAIGGDGGAAAFAGGMQNKNDQIAAAIVLRGLAKDGKFANENNAANGKVVAAVKSAVESG
ncbi:variable large family protein [Borreliella bavariensis]|uniref:variable large family protein n=1 Tax=Borreliella bavariensis TaxID=664662 RepID=UPI001C002D1D|nr:variable large family protein [Borreliella bavariensis]